jgi:bacteriorhodopsin
MFRKALWVGVLSSGIAAAQAVAANTTLTAGQYNTVYNFFSFAIAAMGAAAIFFFLARSQVAPRYRLALLITGLVVTIAGYHYFRIFNSWEAAYTLDNGVYKPSGVPFNDAYRYVDWLLTVPLLLLETVAVLALPAAQGRSLAWKLVIASAFMIALGYPGEVGTLTERFWWGLASTIPFVYILYVLWVDLARSLDRQPADVKVYVRNMRLLLLASWGVYPIAYALPLLGIAGAGTSVGVQVGYTIADVLAKPIFGLLVFTIALLKSQDDAVSGEAATLTLAADD